VCAPEPQGVRRKKPISKTGTPIVFHSLFVTVYAGNVKRLNEFPVDERDDDKTWR
jgi:hypothetical protein